MFLNKHAALMMHSGLQGYTNGETYNYGLEMEKLWMMLDYWIKQWRLW